MPTKVQKSEKRPPKSSKNKMFIFGLRSTSDDQPSDPSDKCRPKCEKSPLSHWKMKCSFLGYVQLLMISWVIWVMKGPLSYLLEIFCVIIWWSSVLSSGGLLAVFCVIFFIINLVTLTLSSDNNNKEDNTEDCQNTTRRLPEDYQKTTRILLS